MPAVDEKMQPFEVLQNSHKTLTLGLQWTNKILATGSSAELDLLSLVLHINFYQFFKKGHQTEVFSCIFQFIDPTFTNLLILSATFPGKKYKKRSVDIFASV
jgi:hypothetical protein